MEEIRLQKFLADAGIASRRKAEELIRGGKVSVNGVAVTEMGKKVSPADEIKVDGQVVPMKEKKVYIMLNKPIGYVSTANDQFGRKTVLDLTREINERIYPVGRLDYDTSGLILLTNDGDFTYWLTHPSHEISKVYRAEIKGIPDDKEISAFRTGLQIEDYTTSPAEFKILTKKAHSTIVEITIHEGKNRQIRKMCDAIGHPVISLKRIAIGSLKLGELDDGKWRYLSSTEIQSLKEKGQP